MQVDGSDDDGRSTSDAVRAQWWVDGGHQAQLAVARLLAAHDAQGERRAPPVARAIELLQTLFESGLRPPLRTVTQPRELDMLFPGSVVTDPEGGVWIHGEDGQWHAAAADSVSAGVLARRGELTVQFVGHVPPPNRPHLSGYRGRSV